jgi:hypothetical protein
MNNSTTRQDAILNAYIECALWSSYDSYDGEGRPLDANYDVEDIAPVALEQMRDDVSDFLADAGHAGALDFWASELGVEQIGHDFWLTRNGHGTGFWDRFATGFGYQCGRVLTEDAKAYGTSDLYVGDDGRLYAA